MIVKTLYNVFFTVFFLLLFAALGFYAVASISTFVKDREDVGIFGLLLTLGFLALLGWLLWEGYWYIIEMGP